MSIQKLYFISIVVYKSSCMNTAVEDVREVKDQILTYSITSTIAWAVGFVEVLTYISENSPTSKVVG